MASNEDRFMYTSLSLNLDEGCRLLIDERTLIIMRTELEMGLFTVKSFRRFPRAFHDLPVSLTLDKQSKNAEEFSSISTFDDIGVSIENR